MFDVTVELLNNAHEASGKNICNANCSNIYDTVRLDAFCGGHISHFCSRSNEPLVLKQRVPTHQFAASEGNAASDSPVVAMRIRTEWRQWQHQKRA
jgi:hypothetical protein